MADHIHVLQINFLQNDQEKSDNIISLLWLGKRKYMIKGHDEAICIKWCKFIDVSHDQLTIKLFSNDHHDCKIVQEFVSNAISEFCTKYGCNISWKMLC